MKNAVLSLSKQQIIWLKNLIRADIHDWESMAARPVDEVGTKFSHLAKDRIKNMRNLLLKLEVVESDKTLRKVRFVGLDAEILKKDDDCLAVVLND